MTKNSFVVEVTFKKIKNSLKINETRFYQKFSTLSSRPPSRGFINYVSIHGFLAIMIF